MAGRLDTDSLLLLHDALARLEQGFAGLPPVDSTPGDPAALRDVLNQVAERLRDNYPYFHPQYAGQMLKPPHAVARLAYALAMWINPNNHALDGGRASSAMEKEAVADIARMFGWDAHLGHLTSGGTMANLEALWIAGELNPGATVVASAQAHYTHGRISAVLKLPFESVPTDARGRMDIAALERRLEAGGVGTVVATLGTTAVGSVDPLADILALRDRYGFRLHADCAYGGYYGLAENLAPATRSAFDRLADADSIVVDPHKHGLQPYGCGCILFRDPAVGRHYRHDSPYTYFSSSELHLGEISLECSRPGAAAVALWATQKLLPLVRGGEFARRLAECRAAALELHEFIARDGRFIAAFEPELDIVVWAVRAGSAAESSARAREIFAKAEKAGLNLALAELPTEFFGDPWRAGGSVTALRSVLMKPEHRAAIPRKTGLLDEVTGGRPRA
ncbi:MAG TPA: aminotransferase class I/II-fold pyridoxal phosphate-dependent enzyme [Steroidobacteraceae bacterium]|nr:aminotransferase class I/II-fold pyridoxal phosphate-dependent enzyme [Steroidobacteraceae bacterium]